MSWPDCSVTGIAKAPVTDIPVVGGSSCIVTTSTYKPQSITITIYLFMLCDPMTLIINEGRPGALFSKNHKIIIKMSQIPS